MKQFSFSDKQGQGLAEYGLLIMAVALTTVAILSLLGVRVGDVICQVAEGIGVGEACNNLLFSDDFSQGADKWHSIFGKDDSWTFTEGDDPKLCYTGSGSDFLMADGSEGSDYVVKTDANLITGNGYGVQFRTTQNDNGRLEGYTFQYDPGYRGGQFIMRKWVNGYELWPPFAAASPPSGYDWHDVERQAEVHVEGNTFTAVMDGEEVLVGQDDTYTKGDAGLRIWSSGNACFDNFSVQSK